MEYADSSAAVFSRIADKSSNSTTVEFVGRLNDRLHCVRRLEPQLLPDAADEVLDLTRHAAERNRGLANALRCFHERRRALAAELVELLG